MTELFLNAIDPLKLIGYTLLFIPGTILASFTTDRHAKTTFRERWFARFWSWFGTASRRRNEIAAGPLIAQASGTVLDIGTGAGNWLSLYDKSKITRIVACEMNREQHPKLLRSARDAGLQDKFEIAAVPVEELTRTGIAKGGFDSIVTLHVLCSADDPRSIARAGYELLRPGGRWFLYEHVKARSPSAFINWWQSQLNVIWPFFLGGCQLCKDTGATLRNAGEWREDTVAPRPDDSPYSVIPDIQGILVKA